MYKKNDIVRLSNLPTASSLPDYHPVKQLVNTVGFVDEVDESGERLLFQSLTKEGNAQLFLTWLPWWCFERESAIEWRVAHLKHLARVRFDRARYAISQIAPGAVAAVDELKKLYDDTLRVLRADNGLSFTMTVFLWPSVVEAILQALQAGLSCGATPNPKPESIPVSDDQTPKPSNINPFQAAKFEPGIHVKVGLDDVQGFAPHWTEMRAAFFLERHSEFIATMMLETARQTIRRLMQQKDQDELH